MKELIKHLYYKYRIFRLLFANDNVFRNDIFQYLDENDLHDSKLIWRALVLFDEHINEIDKMLYRKLSLEDRDICIRWYLKRFLGIDTATTDERNEINLAFEKVATIYKYNNLGKFSFRGTDLIYSCPVGKYDGTYEEKRLMNYYEVTHAFFLVEYEKKGFNPSDEGTIFDCGGANGDTAILFSLLYPSSEIVTFEYATEQYLNIIENLKTNNIHNVTAVQAYLFSDSNNHYIKDGMVLEGNDIEKYGEEIKTLAIDDYVERNGISNVTLIKFDIEGGEQKALEGARRTIVNQKPLLYIPIYHLQDDIYRIPEFLYSLNMPMSFSIKWTEKLVWGVDCVLFVNFK